MLSYFKGVVDCLVGFGIITRAGLRRFVVLPLLINIVLFATAIYFFSKQIDIWVDHLLPAWLSFLEYVLWPLFAIMLFIILFYSFTLLANIIAAPFNSLLAARVEASIGGRAAETMNAEGFWKIVIRSIRSELSKLLYFIKWFIPLVILTFIPGINIIAPLAWFSFASWSFALEYTDYTLGNHEQLFPEVREFNRNNRMRSLGFGSVVFMLTSIPILNFIAMPVAVCGAARMVTKIKEGQNS
jgi:CysZ protein